MSAHRPPPSAQLAQVDVYDRATGSALPVFEKDGRHYIVGIPGHEYAVRIRNCTGGRILAVTSVDGVNVVTRRHRVAGAIRLCDRALGQRRDLLAGARACRAPRRSSSPNTRTATRRAPAGRSTSASSASRCSRNALDRRCGSANWRQERAPTDAESARRKPTRRRLRKHAAPPASASPFAEGARDQAEPRERENAQVNARPAPQPLAKLGTGHGRNETSYVRQVAFERATIDPAQTGRDPVRPSREPRRARRATAHRRITMRGARHSLSPACGSCRIRGSNASTRQPLSPRERAREAARDARSVFRAYFAGHARRGSTRPPFPPTIRTRT